MRPSFKVNNPTALEIPDLVRDGYLGRTMLDGDVAVRSGDTKRRASFCP